jgi:putative transcriptional regulator
MRDDPKGRFDGDRRRLTTCPRPADELTELAERVGMTLANLSILKTGKARAIRFSTLDAICEALSCQPGDLLRFEAQHPERERPPVASKRSAR